MAFPWFSPWTGILIRRIRQKPETGGHCEYNIPSWRRSISHIIITVGGGGIVRGGRQQVPPWSGGPVVQF